MAALLAALMVRVPAITTLPMDSDEPIYLAASTDLAQAIREGQWSRVMTPTLNAEHPSLVKLLYGMGQVAQGTEPDLVSRLAIARSMSLAASLGTVALVTWIHPIAGLALATHTLHSKYGVQAYLDGLPVLWMALAMILGWRSRHDVDGRRFLIAGACWGAALAGKWLHGLPGLALLIAVPSWRGRLRIGLIAVVSWWLLDPSMTLNPFSRLAEMVSAHQHYADALPGETRMVDPILFLASGGPAKWHPEVFPFSLDPLWFGLGVLGIGLNLRKPYGRFLAAWMMVPLIVLMVWDTRWPQHAMVLVVPLCLGIGPLFDGVLSRANLRFGPTGLPPPTSE